MATKKIRRLLTEPDLVVHSPLAREGLKAPPDIPRLQTPGQDRETNGLAKSMEAISSDDGVRLWVDGHLLINRWSDQAPNERSESIALTVVNLRSEA